MNDWLTTTEAAALAGCTQFGILKRIARGQVTAKRDGKRWRVLASSVAPKDKFGNNERPAEARTSTGR